SSVRGSSPRRSARIKLGASDRSGSDPQTNDIQFAGGCTMRPFHQPGGTTRRAFSGYTPEQDAKWQILSDIAYAAGYGFEQTRQPTPGAVLPQDQVSERVHQVEEGWTYESKRDRGSSGLDPAADMPQAAQY